MKYLLLCTIVAMLAISCEKDKISYSQEMLNGTWETTEKNSFGCDQQLEISTFSLSEVKICNGLKMKYKAENYSFNGRIIKYKLYGLNMEYEIKELTENKLLLGYNDPVVYYRVHE